MRKAKRISAAIEHELYSKLKELSKKENRAISEIIRDSLNLYITMTENRAKIEDIILCRDLLSSGENLIVDTEMWVTILGELNKSASEDFWKSVRELGREQGTELKFKGVENLREVLDLLSAKKLCNLKHENNVHTLILTARHEQRFLKEYILGICEELGIDVKIVEGIRKLVIAEGSKR